MLYIKVNQLVSGLCHYKKNPLLEGKPLTQRGFETVLASHLAVGPAWDGKPSFRGDTSYTASSGKLSFYDLDLKNVAV